MRTKIPAGRLELLRRVTLFRGMSDAELIRVDKLMDDITFEAGQVLAREGRPGHEAFIIVRGEATVTIGDREVAVVGPGEVIGEMSLVDQAPRNATLTARTRIEALVIDPAGFGTLLEEAGVRRRVLTTVVKRLRAVEAAATE